MVAKRGSNSRRFNRGLRQREREPEGFGEAIAAGSLTLALMTSLAFVGFAWEQHRERSAHALAVDLVQRLSDHGSQALMPPWSGYGLGPAAPTAQATFEAVRALGGFTAAQAGSCRPASRFATCTGSRYHCFVAGDTPAGPMNASIGLCQGGSGAPWTFDTLDVTVPEGAGDGGNRAEVEVARDGLIRYGSTPPPSEALPLRLHRRGFAMPFAW